MALASCTAITLRMYANRKKLDVRQIRVRVSSSVSTAKTTYATVVEIDGALSDEQQARLMQIAKLCPIHKILTNPIEMDTQLSVVDNLKCE
jgi:putative redox protein